MIKIWKVTYLPVIPTKGIIQFIYQGSESDLESYMDENYGCSCEECMSYESFFDSPSSAEYMIEEINKDEIT